MRLDKFKTLVNNAASKGEAFLFLIDFESEKPVFIPLHTLSEDILFDFNGFSNYAAFKKKKAVKLIAQKQHISDYAKGFEIVKDALKYGDSFLTNYTTKTPIESCEDLKTIFLNSAAPYKLFYKNQFTCFSPETFIKIKEHRIHSFPMKGTIDASIPGAKQKLLSDYKAVSYTHLTLPTTSRV